MKANPNMKARRTKTKIMLAGCLALLAAVTTATAQTLILNGSFESPSIPANTSQQTAPTSWSLSDSAWALINGNIPNPGSWPLSQDGQQHMDIDDSVLSQTLTIASGGTYVLTWFDSTGGQNASSPYSVALLNTSSAIVVSNNLDAGHSVIWRENQVRLPLAPGEYKLQFQNLVPSAQSDTLIDNVSLIRETPPGKTVSGTIVNQVWTPADSPVHVTGNVLVAGLTIQPGVTVFFTSNYVFEVAGKLRAVGTPSSPITFTGLASGGLPASGWQGIYFNNSNPGSVLAHCNISNSVNSGIRIVDSNPLIANCVIANNSAANGGGISGSIAEGDLVVQNCDISNNSSASNGGGVAVTLGANNALRMDGCFLSGNVANPTSSSGNGSFYLGGGIYVTGSSVLRNCVVRNNTCYARSGPAVGSGVSFGGGIYSDTGSIDLRNCLVSGNQAQASVGGGGGGSVARGGGVYISSGSMTIANSIISSNITSASSTAGGGLYADAAQNSSVLNCTLAYNNTEGLYLAQANTSILNSILYFNANNGTQLSGATNVTYCDVQNGFTGTGNINVNPIFLSAADLIIVPGSLCIDRGNTNAAYNDIYFPPSLGTSRNDMGAHGGPGAGARLRVEAWPQVEVFFVGGVPGYTYLLQASTELSSDWQTVKQVQIAHVGDAAYFLEPIINSLPYRFYRLKLAP